MNENLQLPGNPRYQPDELKDIFGYDNLYRGIGQVELASLEVMGEVGFMPSEVAVLLTDEVKEKVLAIRTTDIDATERSVTKQDIRAWVYEAKKVMPEALGPWLHLILTSYDVIDNARILAFVRAHNEVIRPKTKAVLRILCGLIWEFAAQIQIGRTHGQHALPITVGFWLAKLTHSICYNLEEADWHANTLVGKISGAVGAYNAQVGLGLAEKCGDFSFEARVMEKLDLPSADISTQILPVEPLAYYLHSLTMLSASLAQIGRDCRHLMRSEIGEIQEEFESGQSGSSTMAHKRNPINFENLEGTFLKTKNEFGKVMDTLLTDHQRDLVSSSVVRDFPTIVVNVVLQLNTLLRKNKKGVEFLWRIKVDREACERNFAKERNVIMAEALYITMQLLGYHGDAHELVNHTWVRKAKESGKNLMTVFFESIGDDDHLRKIYQKIPSDLKTLLENPEQYTGNAREKAMEIVELVEEYLDE